MEEQHPPIVFYQWLKRRRKALDLTQNELAERAGCSVGALRKIESGERKPSKQLSELLAEALELSKEDQKIFIRVARGELNLERLRQQPPEPSAPLPGVSILEQAKPAGVPSPIHIPLQTTPLIGRENEIAAIERIFFTQECRLLTLTGIGGIGKTRLAIDFAEKKSTAFPGGIFYFPLTSVNSPGKIIPAIADVFDFGFSGPNDPKEQLFTYLSSLIRQKTLFILDNCEHLLIESPAQESETGFVELVSEMLQRVPHVFVLTTSRVRLNLHGEWTYELHGLTVPPATFAGNIEEYNSVALFIKSAQRIKPDFQLTAEEQPSVIRICQLVDGVPLAIELAAAWVGILSSHEIAEEIKSNMDFLTTSMRDIPERHRSIRATFDHSWKLLSEEECQALCQLSVFHGGFDRYAAQEVAGASLELLASLSAKSLVKRTEGGRYDLHEVIRQYALSHLKEYPGHLETYRQHCEYYLVFIQGYEKQLKSSSQQEAVRKLTNDIDNIRAAWVWAIDHKKYDLLGKAGRSFGWYYEITGLYQEGIEQLELLIRSIKTEPENNQCNRAVGLALVHQALLYFRRGEFEKAINLYEESIRILRQVGDKALLADAMIFVGAIYHSSGDYDKAMSRIKGGHAYAKDSNESWFEAFGTFSLGYLESLKGNYSEGYELLMAGINGWRKTGDPHAIAMGLNFFVPTLIKLGRYDDAKNYMKESIALCEHSKNRWGMGTAYSFLGLAYLADSQYEEAKGQLLESLEIFREYTTGWNIGRSLTYLGDAARLAGDKTEAWNYYVGGLHTSIEAKSIPIAMDALLGLSYLLEQSGNVENSLILSCFILSHPSSEEETKIRAQRLRADLESKLDADQITSAGCTAAEKTFEEIIKIALETI